MVLARAARLRPGFALEPLALLGTCLLPRHGASVLVSRREALSRPAALVRLAFAPVPVPGRPVKHRPGSAAHLLRSRHISILRGSPAPGRAFPARRPDRGGRYHVGAWLCGIPPAAVRYRCPAHVRPGVRGQATVVKRWGSGVRDQASSVGTFTCVDLLARSVVVA